MGIKITIPNTSSDTLTFGSANTTTAAQIAGIDSGSTNGQLALYTTASGTSTEAVRITAAQNVGVGTTSPVGKLTVSKAGAEGIEFVPGGTSNVSTTQYYNRSGAAYTANAQDASYHSWLISGAEKARIDTSGNLLVGTTSTSYGARNVIQNNGTTTQPAIACINSTGSGTMRQIDFFTGSNTSRIGSIESTTSTTAYNTSSDYRLKNSIAPMTGALEKVSALNPVTYKWNIDNSDGQGFIAHELAEVVPDCVSGEKDAVDADGNPQYQGIDTSFLIATLTAAIQEQQALITQLQADVAALKGA
jgi:Chaperone of endosialidase